MADESKKPPATDVDLFAINRIYPDAEAVFSFAPKLLSEIKDDAVVILDTNALLLPFNTDPASLKAIRTAYEKLIAAGRLVVPGQVAREFADNRPNVLRELHQQISKRYLALEGTAHYPLLGELPEYKALKKIEKELLTQVEQHKRAIAGLVERVRSWYWDDPVSAMYRELFKGPVIVDPPFDQEKFRQDLLDRHANRIPPGYKDAGKPNGGAGDLLIWHAVLHVGRELKRNAIFVSGDEKSDWWHRSLQSPLYPRFELLEEYRRASGGATLHIARLARLLELMGAEDQVVQAVRAEEAAPQPIPRPTASWGPRAEAEVMRWLSSEGTISVDELSGYLKVHVGEGSPKSVEIRLVGPEPELVRGKVKRAVRAARGRKAVPFTLVLVAPGATFAARAMPILAAYIRDEFPLPPDCEVYIGYLAEDRFVLLNKYRGKGSASE